MLTEKMKLTLVAIAFLIGLIISASHNPLLGVAVLFSTVMLIEFKPKTFSRLPARKR